MNEYVINIPFEEAKRLVDEGWDEQRVKFKCSLTTKFKISLDLQIVEEATHCYVTVFVKHTMCLFADECFSCKTLLQAWQEVIAEGMCEMQPTVVIKFSLQKKTSERPAIYIFAMQRDEINGDWDEIVIIFVID